MIVTAQAVFKSSHRFEALVLELVLQQFLQPLLQLIVSLLPLQWVLACVPMEGPLPLHSTRTRVVESSSPSNEQSPR